MKLEELIIGGFVNFVEEGTDIGGTLVSPTFKPASTDASWHGLGCVTEFRPSTETQEFTVNCPKPTGGYQRRRTTITIADILNFDTAETSEEFWRLLTGVADPIADGVAQIPFAKSERKISGWLQFQARGDDGQDRVVMDVYVDLTLADGTVFNENPVRPVFAAETQDSALSTILPDSIVA